MGKLLKRMGEVSIVLAMFPWSEIDKKALDRTREDFDIKRIVNLSPTNLGSSIDRIRHEFDPSFLKTHGYAACQSDCEDMSRMIDEYDVVWVHNIQTANAFQIYRWPHTVLDVDDIQSRLYLSMARTDSGVIRSLLDYRRSAIWWRRERLYKDRFEVLVVCSDHDRRYFRDTPSLHVIPNGFTSPSQVPKRDPTIQGRLGFIGTFHHMPNRTGVEWFLRTVWPKVKRDAPQTRLRLVGRDSDKDFPGMGPDIDGLGFVDNPTDEIATWSAMIVPIREGGGTRIKIAEAFSRKCPVVSTSFGAFGYEVRNGEDLLLADNDRDFASECVRLLNDKELGLRLSDNAWKKFLKSWTWDSMGPLVYSAVEQCRNRSRREFTHRDT